MINLLLLLAVPIVLVFFYKKSQRLNEIHSEIIDNLSENINNQTKNLNQTSNQSYTTTINNIDFKFQILKKQLELLKLISSQ